MCLLDTRMLTVNLVLHALLTIYHLISNETQGITVIYFLISAKWGCGNITHLYNK